MDDLISWQLRPVVEAPVQLAGSVTMFPIVEIAAYRVSSCSKVSRGGQPQGASTCGGWMNITRRCGIRVDTIAVCSHAQNTESGRGETEARISRLLIPKVNLENVSVRQSETQRHTELDAGDLSFV